MHVRKRLSNNLKRIDLLGKLLHVWSHCQKEIIISFIQVDFGLESNHDKRNYKGCSIAKLTLYNTLLEFVISYTH